MNSLRKGGIGEGVGVGEEVEALGEFLKRDLGLRIEGRGNGEDFRKVKSRDMVFGEGGRGGGAFWRGGGGRLR